MNLLERAKRLDREDAIAPFRNRFQLPEGIIYLDGNSLGALPKATPAAMARAVENEWGQGLIRSWNEAGWFELGARVGAKIAPLIGALPHEVIATDTVSINLFKLISAALAKRPGRKVVLSEAGNFPTDVYMIQGLEQHGLAKRRLVDRADLGTALTEDVALLMLTHSHYKTGEVFDIISSTKAAHDVGALVLWDLSHSTGALPVHLNEAGADFATGCGYKYLCGGPGAPAFAFVAERHLNGLKQPLTGWFGHARPFAFLDDYEPAQGVEQLQCGTSPVLGLTALEVGVDLINEIGIERLYAKSRALSEFFIENIAALGIDLELVSPAESLSRGSQLSFRHHHAYAICQALIARGVIGDFRDPDILRLGFAPAYLSFANVAEAARHLSEVLSGQEWEGKAFSQRGAVT